MIGTSGSTLLSPAMTNSTASWMTKRISQSPVFAVQRPRRGLRYNVEDLDVFTITGFEVTRRRVESWKRVTVLSVACHYYSVRYLAFW